MEQTKQQAEQAGKVLKSKLGPGWKIRVWENFGWHVCASAANGHISVYDGGDGYSCLMSHDTKHAGDMELADDYYNRDPKKVVRHSLDKAKVACGKWQRLIEAGEKAIA